MNSPDAEPSLLDAALDLAGRGLRVLPAYPDDKRPRLVGWPNLATTDPLTIEGWWHKWPDSRISIATGKDSGFVVLDIDPAHGGDEALCALEATLGELPQTLEVLTGGSGRHLYFRHPGALVPTRTAVCGMGGLDVRGEGGQVIAPPSVHENGRVYTWELSTEPSLVSMAALPLDWTTFLTTPSSAPPRAEDWPAPSINLPDLSKQATTILRAGSVKRDSSVWVLQLANAAVIAGWNPTDLWLHLMNPSNLGGKHLQHWCKERGESEARRRFWLAWEKAQFDRRPAARHVARVRAAMGRDDWSGVARSTDRAVMDALCLMCVRAGGGTSASPGDGETNFRASVREIAEHAYLSIGTVSKSLTRLRQAGWVKRSKNGGSRGAQTLRLTIPHHLREECDPEEADPSLPPHGVGTVRINELHLPQPHDVFGRGGLSLLAQRVWQELMSSDDSRTVRDLMSATQQCRPNPVRQALRALAATDPPMAIRVTRTSWRGVEADLDIVAEGLGVAGRRALKRAKHEQERNRYQAARWLLDDGRRVDPQTGEITSAPAGAGYASPP